ncbi:MAG: CHAT domain-containing protein [Saprospiraceae bacterium]|nr:CHAT domain-containing protein [Lewinella sp.]
MTTQPVILLTFSNNTDDYLEMIVSEQKAIKKALLDFVDKNYLEVRDVQHASTEEIFYLVNRYHERLHIFHYGGHADQQSLQLERKVGVVQTADVQGIAGLLGTQSQLKLVFLNGCATKGQVKSLLDAGVPAVIATRVSIKDREAQQFSEQFYLALATDSTIAEAFRKAKAFIETSRKELKIIDIEATRNIKLDKFDEDEIPWGLYFHADQDEVLNWSLPRESPLEIDFGPDEWKRQRMAPVNEILVDDSLKAIRDSEIVKELARKIHRERKEGNPGRKPTDAEKKDAIVRAYPAPVSVHLRALFSHQLSKKYDTDRLRQLVNTYRQTTIFLTFILLSELWDASYRREDSLSISAAERLQLGAFFNLNPLGVATFDYFMLADALLRLAHRNGITLYIEGLQNYPDGWKAKETLQTANDHFQRMQQGLDAGIPDHLMEHYALSSEQQLARVLEELHFLAQYKMAVVKNIEVFQLKNIPPTAYRHIIVEIDNNYQDIGEKDRQQELEAPTDMESVLFYKDQLNHSLNLSPFIIDENALLREYNSKMYFFSYADEEGLHYYWMENEKDKLIVSRHHYPQIFRQFERARQEILGEKTHSKPATDVDDEDILSLI